MSAYVRTDGMTESEAEAMRLEGAQVWGCWWCLARSSPRPYWFAEETTFRGHRIACWKHRTEPE